ncbi:hypothetical protein [Pseudomonas sp. FME51]|uniref:hypothetical protein n=1 Tax=Pseudomonas sp. FME51 TaxID=2742609 RepID=UPI001865D531|nr:hypothetical protein [Pseudomonas sp. FME51]
MWWRLQDFRGLLADMVPAGHGWPGGQRRGEAPLLHKTPCFLQEARLGATACKAHPGEAPLLHKTPRFLQEA